MTKQDFERRANAKHNFKYENGYKCIEYTGSKGIMDINCPVKGHGSFKQKAGLHLRGTDVKNMVMMLG